MSLADQILADVDDVFLQADDFAGTVLRLIGGDSANVVQIMAVVTIETVGFDDGRGRGYRHKASMFLNSDVVLNTCDAVKVGDDRYEIEAIGDKQYGRRIVSLVRYQSESRGAKPLRTGGL